jgi:hypothetical protein
VRAIFVGNIAAVTLSLRFASLDRYASDAVSSPRFLFPLPHLLIYLACSSVFSSKLKDDVLISPFKMRADLDEAYRGISDGVRSKGT